MKIVVIEPLGINELKLKQIITPIIKAEHDIVCYSEKTEDKTELIKRGREADVIIVANQPLREDELSHCENLKFISVAFTGVDHIDLPYCKKAGIQVSNAAGYSTNAVAELTFGLAIDVLRNVVPCDERCRNEGTKDGLIGSELYKKTFGVVGTGAIGQKVAKIAKAFDCEVIAYSRTEKQELKDISVKYITLDEVIKASDILSLHVPFNEETNKLLNKERIALMKKEAIVINTARGGVVDSAALAEALNSGNIAGAGIDVFETEPPIAKGHPLLNSKNTVVTPHIAFASKEALITRAEIVVDNVLSWEKGNQKNIIC